jgi:hypothetical protein
MIDQLGMPGMGDPVVSSEYEFLWGNIHTYQIVDIRLDSAAVDAGSSPTTTLRRGNILGPLCQINHFPSPYTLFFFLFLYTLF